MRSLKERGITVLLGPYGSGKTEISINYALYLARRSSGESAAKDGGGPGLSSPVWLIDLDLVTPYFRARDIGESLLPLGVKVVAAPPTDLPVLPPGVSGLLKRGGPGVVDVGGGENGARMLGSLLAAMPPGGLRVWLVFNPYRPGCRSVAGLLAAAHEVSTAARLTPTGVVSNPHLGPATSLRHVLEGHRTVTEAAAELGLPVVMISVIQDLAPTVEKEVREPVFSLRRFMPLPWE